MTITTMKPLSHAYHFEPGTDLSAGAGPAAPPLLLLRPETLAGGILLRPMVVLEPPEMPGLSGKRVLISSGAHDPIVPSDHPPLLGRMLSKAGVAVTVRIHEAGHRLVREDFAAAHQFLNSP